jgi:hypothetical protein
MSRAGIGRKAIAKLRREGMPVMKAGRRAFVDGTAFHEALRRRTEAAK